jgi:hypothetical protein
MSNTIFLYRISFSFSCSNSFSFVVWRVFLSLWAKSAQLFMYKVISSKFGLHKYRCKFQFIHPRCVVRNYRCKQNRFKHNSINDFIKWYFLHCFFQRHVSAPVMVLSGAVTDGQQTSDNFQNLCYIFIKKTTASMKNPLTQLNRIIFSTHAIFHNYNNL